MASVEEHPPAVALRADAARNRERIIEAAAEVFAERGLDVSTAEIAEHAGSARQPCSAASQPRTT